MIFETGEYKVEFRTPNIADGMIMLGKLKVSPAFFADMTEFQKSPDYFTFIGNLMLEMKSYFVSSTIPEVDTFDKLLSSEYAGEMVKWCGEFLRVCLGNMGDAKKKQ